MVETDIHYPTDSTLLGVTRAMKRIAQVAGAVGVKWHDRTRSVRYRLLEISRASGSRSEHGQDQLRECYKKLLSATSRVVGQAKRFAREVAAGVKRGARSWSKPA